MGSAQSARGIQPDGPRPSPPAARAPSTLSASLPGRRRGRGPPAGRGPTAAVGRISSAAVRRDRLRFGLEGSGGEGGSWLRPRALQRPPAPTSPLTPGPRASYLRAFPGPPSSPPPLRGGGRAGARGTGPLRPRRGCRPGRTVLSPPPDRAAPPGRGPAHDTKGARGPRRCRPPNRPVLKHGPRSLTRARVRGLGTKPHGAMKVEAGARRPRWDPRAPARGAPPARLYRPVGEVEPERARWYPKDGELCPGRAKPEETLVEARSGPDVQIGRPTWV